MDRITKLNEEVKNDRLYSTIEMLVRLGLDKDYKTMRDIKRDAYYLGYEFDARGFRRICEDIMNYYLAGEIDSLVVGTNKGYKLTNSTEDLELYLAKKRNQAMSLIANYHHLKKQIIGNTYYKKKLTDYVKEMQ